MERHGSTKRVVFEMKHEQGLKAAGDRRSVWARRRDGKNALVRHGSNCVHRFGLAGDD